MTKGCPSTTKPTWQTKPSSRIPLTVSRSNEPRFGRRLSVVRAVGEKSSAGGVAPPRVASGTSSILSAAFPLPESLRGDAQRAVELARSVLPRDHLGQLDDLVVVVEPAQPREQLVGHVSARHGHRVRVRERRPLGPRVERARLVIVEGVDLLVSYSQLAADRSVNVLSKLAAVVPGHAAVDERDEPRVEQARAVQPLPHRAHAAEDGRPPGVDCMVGERRPPLLCLRPEDAARIVVGLFRFDSLDSLCAGLLDVARRRSYNRRRQVPQKSPGRLILILRGEVCLHKEVTTARATPGLVTSRTTS